MFLLAVRNLFQNRLRIAFSIGGIGLALLLTLSLDAIVAGYEAQLTAYIEHSGADVWVSQSGVRNLHMAVSAVPAAAVGRVEAVPGVASVTPILYMSNIVALGSQKRLSYVIGLPPAAAAGTPWAGTDVRVPGSGQIVIDRLLADQLSARMGDRVDLLGMRLTVAGLSQGTASIVNYVSFMSEADFRLLRPSAGAVSFLLVKAAPGVSAQTLVQRLAAALPQQTVQTTADFARNERQIVRDMSTDVINAMDLVGFLVGLAVVALTVYMATMARRGEYGVVKALGGSNLDLYRVVVWQALLSVALGYAVGAAGSLALAAGIPLVQPLLVLVVTPASLLTNGGVALAIAILAALLPIRQISGLDPVTVFRRRYA